MSKIYRIALLLLLVMLIVSCAAPAIDQPTPSAIPPSISTATIQPVPEATSEDNIVRHPAADDFSAYYSQLTSIPKYDPSSADTWQVDLRSQDLTELDMTGSLTDLMHATFDSKTQWPLTDNKMPADFDPQKIMEIGKDPGLGIRALHEQGINGKGIAIAIVDQPLLVDHQEYKDRIRLYEEINVLPESKAAMHGAAVTSIAAGKTTGVAPQADVYYIGSWTGDWEPDTNNFTWNFKYYAQAIRRILELNQKLPDDQKIRVIAMQVGWSPDQAGYEEITAAVKDAKEAGVFVISSSLSETYILNFHGLGREPLADPNDFTSYGPGVFWQQQFFDRGSFSNTLLVPMDSRTTASPTGTEDYAFYRVGGWSWAIPYLAGMYALAAQVKPDITPKEFWDAALKTGKTNPLQHDGKEYQFGVILDPQALIEEIKGQ
jgi:hypothetical protein